jgi:hypothetical protein
MAMPTHAQAGAQEAGTGVMLGAAQPKGRRDASLADMEA